MCRTGANSRAFFPRRCAVRYSCAQRSHPRSSLSWNSRAAAGSNCAKTGYSGPFISAARPRSAPWRGDRRFSMDARAQRLRLVEALLFAADQPLGEEALSRHLDETAELPELLRELAQQYAGRGINLVKLAGGWAFRTAPDLAPKLR